MAQLKEMWFADKHHSISVDLPAIYVAKGVPPHQCRLELLYDFLDAHDFMIGKCTYSAPFARGGPAAFDFSRTCMFMKMRYRRDCGGNPARANTLEDVRFEDLADFLAHDPRAIPAVVAFQEECEQQEAQLRAKTLPNGRVFMGLLKFS